MFSLQVLLIWCIKITVFLSAAEFQGWSEVQNLLLRNNSSIQQLTNSLALLHHFIYRASEQQIAIFSRQLHVTLNCEKTETKILNNKDSPVYHIFCSVWNDFINETKIYLITCKLQFVKMNAYTVLVRSDKLVNICKPTLTLEWTFSNRLISRF